jgi:hypothetical protein
MMGGLRSIRSAHGSKTSLNGWAATVGLARWLAGCSVEARNAHCEVHITPVIWCKMLGQASSDTGESEGAR